MNDSWIFGIGNIVKIQKKLCLPHMWYTLPHLWVNVTSYVVYYTTCVVYYTANVNSPEIPILLKEHSPPLVFERLIFKKEIVLSTKKMAIFNFDQFWTNVMVSFFIFKKIKHLLKGAFYNTLYVYVYVHSDGPPLRKKNN